MTSPFSLYIGIPAYNAASSLAQVIEEVEKNHDVKKIIVVDDASSDATPALLKEREFPKVYHVRNESNRGYGGTVKRIFSEFRKLSSDPNDLIIILHSDGQTPPNEIPLFIKAYADQQADIILGSRMLAGFRAQWRNRPLFKIAGDFVLTGLQNWAYGLSVSSYASGYRAFRRGALDQLQYEACENKHNFDTEVILEAKSANLRMIEIPVKTVKSKQISNNELVGYAARSVKTFFKYGNGRLKPTAR